MISKRIQNTMESSAAMGNMFTAGERLAKRFGAENVYNFSIGNPNVPAPESVKDTIIDLAQNMPEQYDKEALKVWREKYEKAFKN